MDKQQSPWSELLEIEGDENVGKLCEDNKKQNLDILI
jgi:hypothetical protein